jgi:glucose/arabinose dehydrogenase
MRVAFTKGSHAAISMYNLYSNYLERNMMKPSHKKLLLLTILSAITLALLGGWNLYWGYAQGLQDKHTYFPAIQSPASLPPADAATQRISLPAGFAIRIFAANLSSPRLMTVGPDGWIYVALMGSGQVVRLPDRDHNGLADSTEIVTSGLASPHNLEWFNGWMYVAELGRIERFKDQNNDGVYETRELVTNNIPGSGGHSSRTLHFGPDGKLYVSAGSSCNICVESDPRRAAILRFNPDGTIPADNPFANDPDTSKRPLWAWGLRNSVDFLWTPTGAMWASTMGSDLLGDTTPPEVLIDPIQKGKWYGWPYCYNPSLGVIPPNQPQAADTRMALPAGQTCAQAVAALLTDPAHSAPIGMSFANKSTWPAAYQDDLFIAEHGSWNTSTSANYRDCKVERVVIESGAVVRSETFASGWRAPGKLCGDATTWGRPAGITFGADGAMYISDDKGGRVYRVVYTGQ